MAREKFSPMEEENKNMKYEMERVKEVSLVRVNRVKRKGF